MMLVCKCRGKVSSCVRMCVFVVYGSCCTPDKCRTFQLTIQNRWWRTRKLFHCTLEILKSVILCRQDEVGRGLSKKGVVLTAEEEQ